MLDSLLLHDTTRRQCRAAITAPPHALLLCGPRGSGASTIAKEIAQNVGTLLEVIYPKKRQPNGSYEVDTQSGTVMIDDIRQLYERTKAKFTSPQVVIIDTASRSMSHTAQNAFLKLLEEPQQHIHFILVIRQPSDVLPTILSRCQRIDIRPISTVQSETLLDTLDMTDPTKRARVLFIASGLPAEITRLGSDDAYYQARIATVQDARAILEGDGYTRLKLLQRYKDKRPEALQLIDDMTHQLRLSTEKSVSSSVVSQLDHLIEAYERIAANGNISLQLAKVLL